MRIEIFTEGSETTQDEQNFGVFSDFFRGQFISVQSLAESLAEYGEVNLHILSDEFGYVTGSDTPTDRTESLSKTDYTEFSNALVAAAGKADVIVVLLTADIFNRVVSGQWEDLVQKSDKDKIWCLGASRGALSSVNLSGLQEQDTEVIIYERVGVARIGNETRESLLESISSRANAIDTD
jgi:hypothetical protein